MSSTSRTSNGTARSPRNRTQVNLSTIEKSVTHLLVATKQLLETLTSWSRGTASEAEVSDVYVRLGSEFNIACRAFTAIGVETNDLGNVPDALRTILEHTLSQDASPQSLDVYLPRIREIIINLLHGLKRKQQKLRQKQSREGESSRSTASMPPPSRNDSVGGSSNGGDGADGAPPRTSSLPVGNGPRRESSPQPTMRPGGAVRNSAGSLKRSSHVHNSSISSIPIPEAPPYPTPENPPLVAEPTFNSPVVTSPVVTSPQFVIPPPPPTPPSQDALAALQQHSQLERRASRRYSAYQVAKLLTTGKAPGDVPLLPTTRDPSATPRNRESMDAVRKRSTRTRSMIRTSRPEARGGSLPRRISEEREPASPSTPVPATPEAQLASPIPVEDDHRQPLSIDTNVNSPGSIPQETPIRNISPERRSSTPSSDTKELTLFLQLGRNIRKVTIDPLEEQLTINFLRLKFISRFNYNPPSGDDFPEIYLQDPVSGVRYELEDLRDVKDRSVLCLNVEVLDEVKRHIDDGLGDLKKLVQSLSTTVESQSANLTKVALQQEEAAKRISELSFPVPAPPAPAIPSSPAPPGTPPTAGTPRSARKPSFDNTPQKLAEVRDMRKDLAILRQVFSSFVGDVNTSMTSIKATASKIKSTAATSTLPVSASNEGRIYVETGRQKLSVDADSLVMKVDDLQDTVEDIRKDVVTRGVRPLPRQLSTVAKEIADAKEELKKMMDYIKKEKPRFRKVWERELTLVCEEQEFFTMQESLCGDLEDDLEKASQTFVLVEQCSKSNQGGVRQPSRGFVGLGAANGDDLDPEVAKDSVLSEVRALQPNHEGRLEAIERAERARMKELENRGRGEFQKELGEFVEEGKLKKAGGFEEVERMRAQKEEESRKAIWEFKMQIEESSDEEEEDGEQGAEDNEDEDTESDSDSDDDSDSEDDEPAKKEEEKK
ncbi:actin interacting protein 3-domain-containing protein [Pyronema domesticum]|uniref:Similar to Bud site selection protein 6 acc. no. P41697 n=1 Tax=Pyronema omphalodes (strain CBS 100304) TaxID=1076935 RepID=U4L401_PYROM|nr:actin interacting protein 3-domain-containing protein [Pyronema domesticum]CCX10459.1 Similar to Bud site selection protein 6; acc. no. P41697 [Pyronema omphalodes CBS 100304]